MNTLLQIYPGDGCLSSSANVLVQVTAVILTAWLLARLGNRWNAAWRHTVLFVALLFVLASPILSWVMQNSGIAFVTLRTSPPTAPVQISAVPLPEPRADAMPTKQGDVAVPVNLETNNLEHVLPSRRQPANSFPDVLRACGGLVVIIWLAGMAFRLARWSHGLYLIAALRQAVRPFDCEPMAEMMLQVRQALGTTTLPLIATSAGLDRPIMVGLIRPLVILPEDVARTLPRPQLADILIHECAHAVCRHHVVALLQRVAGTFFWFHPLVHLMNRELSRAREEVCDNYVLRRSDAPRYARTLLELSQLLVDTSPKRTALGLFHYRWTLEDRVADLLDRRRRVVVRVNRWTATALSAVFLFLGLLIAGTRIVQAEPALPEAEPAVKQESAVRTSSSSPAIMSALSPGERPPWNTNNPYAGNVFAVKFSPDGKTLASSWGDGTIKLWDVASYKNTAVLVTPRRDGSPADEQILIKSLAYSPDGKTIASGGCEGTKAGMIRLWNVASGENTAAFNGSTEKPRRLGLPGIYQLVFTNDGKTLITGNEDNLIRFFDAASGKITAKLEADSDDTIYALALSPDGKTLASGGAKGTINLWNVANGTNTAMFKAVGKGNSVYSLAFGPDGKTLGAGCWMEGGGMLWDIASGTNTVKFKPDRADSAAINNPNDMTYSVAFSPDGRIFAQGCDNGIIALWDVKGRKKLAILTGHSALVRCLAFSPDGNTLASGGDDSSVKLWSVEAKGERAEGN
ncbi:MAG TPA: M56 family metallopeptidase [Pirellulales bacterium]|nr:M56 family metallopeptidase [Pirellulales bacterium]